MSSSDTGCCSPQGKNAVFYSAPLARKSQEEKWRAVLMGEARGHICWSPWMRRISRSIPSDPRCKLCDTPFGAPGNLMRFIGFGPSRLNRRICSGCIHALEKRPGEAALELLEETGHGEGEPWVPLGAGVHTGVAYVGSVGEGDAFDFTALGDSVNTTARLAASAGAGEILVSSTAAKASGLDTAGLESRTLELRGRAESVQAWVAA